MIEGLIKDRYFVFAPENKDWINGSIYPTHWSSHDFKNFYQIACVQPIYKTIIINATLMHLNEEKKIV